MIGRRAFVGLHRPRGPEDDLRGVPVVVLTPVLLLLDVHIDHSCLLHGI
jgi:hypothetical protein